MRFLLIFLLIANLALFLYVRGEDAPPAPSPPPFADDKIVLIKSLDENEPVPAAAPAAPAASPPPSAPATACLQWGPVADVLLDSARAALSRVPDIGAYQETRQQGPARSWLVSIDGFNNRNAAINRANELRRQGINDVSVLEPPESGSTYALSLGVFSSEQGAQSRLAALNEKKINNVKVTPRGGVVSIFFVVSNATPALEQHLRELMPRFVDSAVQSIACPSPQSN
ncbi:MAG: SPOR domain-containing protein [Proteobacteria bacterium]|nr:SPOR domain-containing protein [Pseudomonadota bacterium]MCL2307916.1 SPOR domain-containing protein [Pseudomonadota bacterium]